MTTPVAEAREDRRSGPGRVLLCAVTALVAAAAGVGGTLLYQRISAPDTSGVEAQAAEIAEELRADLRVGLSSGGRSYGGRFTEGTLVAHVEAHGGVLLSSGNERNRGAGDLHTAEVMLGLTPPGTGTVAVTAYPVRCYRYTFGVGAHSVRQSGMPCPARTDGRPGSLAAQMGVLLARQPAGVTAYRPLPTAGHAHTPEGAVDFLKDQRLIAAGDTVTEVSGRPAGPGTYAVALRLNGACHYLRMDSSPTASRRIPLWLAPADEQQPCAAPQAASAATLHGTDPSQQG
ncbi:hypothetical protein ACIGO8_13745 [Streptomyces sp. NPDC053493]|uniref:hypothetical protein n=1 Tax=Streptomyces sp. NPDC053493 TaxID=3365705 RepID=UPI0037CD1F84